PWWAASSPQIMNGDEPLRSASIWAVAAARAENPLMPRALMKLPFWLSRAVTETPAAVAGRPVPVLVEGQAPRSLPASSTRRQSGVPLTLLAASEATTASWTAPSWPTLSKRIWLGAAEPPRIGAQHGGSPVRRV